MRDAVRSAVIGYSWTSEEEAQYGDSDLTNVDDDAFDTALSDIYLKDEATRRDYGKLQRTANAVR